MPRTCSVCAHPDRAAIDGALVNGETFRHIASRYGVSTTALQRHKTDHIPAALSTAKAAGQVANADDLLTQLGLLRSKALGLLMKAEAAGDYRTALAGIREARGCIEVMARMMGELADSATVVNILITPEWTRVQAAMLSALAPYPDARVAVADALVAIGGPS